MCGSLRPFGPSRRGDVTLSHPRDVLGAVKEAAWGVYGEFFEGVSGSRCVRLFDGLKRVFLY